MSSPLTEKSINLNCLIFPSVYVPLKIVIFSSGGSHESLPHPLDIYLYHQLSGGKSPPHFRVMVKLWFYEEFLYIFLPAPLCINACPVLSDTFA